MFKYEWIWEKDKPANFALANKQPMKYHENILVFYNKQPTYNKQLEPRKGSGKKRYKYPVDNSKRKSDHNNIQDDIKMFDPELKNPSSIQVISTGRRQDLVHPTQKPVALMEYLIKTYTNENDTILDFTMGSGSTLVAAKNLNRNAYGIEKDEKYFEIAKNRIENT
jgi:site-specific DNA-methyltransferase (adenine-specific)